MPELEDNNLIFFDPTELKGRWNQVFKNDNPIYLELGAGRGKFTTISAERNPDINYIALEMEAGALVYAARKFKESGLDNIRGIRSMAQKLLEFFDEGEISKIYINFCNPWPKNRQHKRRLTYPTLLKIYKSILHEKGTIELKTDDLPFFEDSLKYFEKAGLKVSDINYDLPADKNGNIVTEYEAKWRSQGVKINYLMAEKE